MFTSALNAELTLSNTFRCTVDLVLTYIRALNSVTLLLCTEMAKNGFSYTNTILATDYFHFTRKCHPQLPSQ